MMVLAQQKKQQTAAVVVEEYASPLGAHSPLGTCRNCSRWTEEASIRGTSILMPAPALLLYCRITVV